MASSCRADSRPELIVVSAIDRVYVMSGGGTLDRVLVSTTMSGWEIPIVAEERGKNKHVNGKLHESLLICRIKKKLDVDIQSSGLHLEGLYSANVSTCPSSSVSSSSASSSSSGGGWVLWTWEHHRGFSNVIPNNDKANASCLSLNKDRLRKRLWLNVRGRWAVSEKLAQHRQSSSLREQQSISMWNSWSRMNDSFETCW